MRPPAFLVLLSACSHPGVVPARAPIEMAITFDDLPRAGPDIPGMSRLRIHREILAVLRKHAVPQAYGFINGKGAEDADGRAALEAWVAAGYPLGNHTYSHRTPEELPAYLADLHRNEPLLRELLPGPEDRWKVFLQSAQTFLAFDDSFARRLFGRRIRHILLLHGGAFGAVMLDDLLSLYESAGVRWISFDDAQRDPVYGHDAQVAPTGGDILQEQVAMERQTPMIPWVTMPLKQLAALCP